VVCRDAADTCERNLCECDLDFAKKIPGQLHHFTTDYHLFWSEIGWEPESDEFCVRGGKNADPQCCGPDTGPLFIYNSIQKQCCDDFSIQPMGMC
jgi:hypothetical protein